MAPYIANRIRHATSTFVDGQEQTNLLANTMAHAVAGAVLAQLAGNNAAAGAAGAAGGELMARAILTKMYPGKQASELTQDEKEIVSALGQLSAGVASGSAECGIQGAVAGKNAVENNALKGEDAQKKSSIELALSKTGLALHPRTPEEVSELEARHEQLTQLDAAIDKYAQDACSQGKTSDACQDAHALVQGLQDSYRDFLGQLTYKELNREDYAKVSQIVANTTAGLRKITEYQLSRSERQVRAGHQYQPSGRYCRAIVWFERKREWKNSNKQRGGFHNEAGAIKV